MQVPADRSNSRRRELLKYSTFGELHAYCVPSVTRSLWDSIWSELVAISSELRIRRKRRPVLSAATSAYRSTGRYRTDLWRYRTVPPDCAWNCALRVTKTFRRNLVHASDSAEAARKEIAIWFSDSEHVHWQPTNKQWLFDGSPEKGASYWAAAEPPNRPDPIPTAADGEGCLVVFRFKSPLSA